MNQKMRPKMKRDISRTHPRAETQPVWLVRRMLQWSKIYPKMVWESKRNVMLYCCVENTPCSQVFYLLSSSNKNSDTLNYAKVHMISACLSSGEDLFKQFSRVSVENVTTTSFRAFLTDTTTFNPT